MKIAITAQGKDLDAKVDPRFGRTENFIIIDTETMKFDAVANEGLHAAHGAGTQAALLMSKYNVEALITGNVGPNAFQTLTAAGIKMFKVNGGTVAEAIEKFKNNELQEILQAGPAGH